jgi:hypothetical protein
MPHRDRPRRRQQAEGPGPLDGLRAAVHAQLANRCRVCVRTADAGMQRGEFRSVRETGEFQIGPPDPVRQRHALL